MSIQQSDIDFLEGVVDRSVESGFIDPPVPWNGRYVDRVHYDHHGGTFCCFWGGSGGGRSNDKGDLVVLLIICALGFFIGLMHTIESSKKAIRAERDLLKAEYDETNHSDEQQVQSLYRDARIILQGQRDERMFAAFAQGLMTVGAGLLTIGILAAIIAEPQIWSMGLSLAGGSTAGFGALLFAVKSCTYDKNDREQAAANRIGRALYSPSY